MLATLQAIHDVAADLATQGIGKDNFNKDQKFAFRGIDQVHASLAPLLAKHGLVILPQVVGRASEERVTKSGTKMRCVTVDVQYTIVSINDGDSMPLVVRFVGEGHDSGDKATAKAMSVAYKYMAIQTFCIPVDAQSIPDADAESPEESVSENHDSERPVSRQASRAIQESEPRDGDDRVAQLRALLEQAEYNEGPILDYYKVDRLEALTEKDLKSIKLNLRAMISKRNASKKAATVADFGGVRE